MLQCLPAGLQLPHGILDCKSFHSLRDMHPKEWYHFFTYFITSAQNAIVSVQIRDHLLHPLRFMG